MNDSIINSLFSTLDKIASISVTDLAGNIVYVNDKFLDVTKYSRKELIGANHRILKSGFHDNEFYKQMWKTITSGNTWRGEIKNKNKVGEFYWVDSTVAPIRDSQGNVIGYAAIRFPIDERKNLETSLSEKVVEQSKAQKAMLNLLEDLNDDKTKLEEAMSKDEFLSIAAHHLRTPLGTLRWSLELIKSGHSGTIPDNLKEIINNMMESDLELIYLVNELLDVTKINQGKITEYPSEFDSYEVIDSEINKLKLISDQKNVKISKDFDAVTGPKLFLDRKLFSQVITNILSNSIKYNKPKGTVLVKAFINKDKLKVEISDSGIGIPKNDSERVFSKFFRAGNVSISEAEGTGLGLFIVKSYIERWGGSVGIKSYENKGTTVYFDLPIKVLN